MLQSQGNEDCKAHSAIEEAYKVHTLQLLHSPI